MTDVMYSVCGSWASSQCNTVGEGLGLNGPETTLLSSTIIQNSPGQPTAAALHRHTYVFANALPVSKNVFRFDSTLGQPPEMPACTASSSSLCDTVRRTRPLP